MIEHLLSQLGTGHDPSGAQIVMGTVGWEDAEDHYFVGDENENDGYTLVRVALYDGRDKTKPLNPGVAQGHKIICQLASNIFRIPTKGTRVYVAIPRGMDNAVGAGCIIASVEKDRRYNLTDGSIELTGRTGAGKVIVRNDGSVTLFTSSDNTDNGKSVYVRVANDGMQFVGPWGTLKFDDTGFHVLTASGASFDLGGIYGLPSPFDALGTYARIQAAMIEGKASAVSFGAGATPVADSTQVLAAVTAVVTAIGVVATQLSTLGGTLSAALHTPTFNDDLGTLVSLVGTNLAAANATLTSAITTLTPLMPKMTSSA